MVWARGGGDPPAVRPHPRCLHLPRALGADGPRLLPFSAVSPLQSGRPGGAKGLRAAAAWGSECWNEEPCCGWAPSSWRGCLGQSLWCDGVSRRTGQGTLSQPSSRLWGTLSGTWLGEASSGRAHRLLAGNWEGQTGEAPSALTGPSAVPCRPGKATRRRCWRSTRPGWSRCLSWTSCSTTSGKRHRNSDLKWGRLASWARSCHPGPATNLVTSARRLWVSWTVKTPSTTPDLVCTSAPRRAAPRTRESKGKEPCPHPGAESHDLDVLQCPGRRPLSPARFRLLRTPPGREPATRRATGLADHAGGGFAGLGLRYLKRTFFKIQLEDVYPP